MVRASKKEESDSSLSPEVIVERVRAWSLMNRLVHLDDPWVSGYWFEVVDGISHALHRSSGSTSCYFISNSRCMVGCVCDRLTKIRTPEHREAVVNFVRAGFGVDVPFSGDPTDLDAQKRFFVDDQFTFCASATFGNAEWTEIPSGARVEVKRWPRYLVDLCCGSFDSFLRKGGWTVDRSMRVAVLEHALRREPIDEPLFRLIHGSVRLTAAVRRQIREIAARHEHPCLL
jgi:hypothetical protein